SPRIRAHGSAGVRKARFEMIAQPGARAGPRRDAGRKRSAGDRVIEGVLLWRRTRRARRFSGAKGELSADACARRHASVRKHVRRRQGRPPPPPARAAETKAQGERATGGPFGLPRRLIPPPRPEESLSQETPPPPRVWGSFGGGGPLHPRR